VYRVGARHCPHSGHETGKPRTIPLTDEAIHILTGLAAGKSDASVFPITANALKLGWQAEGFPHILVDEYVVIWGVVVGVARKVP